MTKLAIGLGFFGTACLAAWLYLVNKDDERKGYF